jgi:NADH-quinone oxidoreductase subunit C|tara:strand:- start:2559 stop:3185 length:627 start_codon:yes stop_codon:yes gene_type:complete
MAIHRYDSERQLKKLYSLILDRYGNKGLNGYVENNALIISVKKNSLYNIINSLKDDKELEFKQLIDICAVDYPEREKRFDIVYQLLSVSLNYRLRIKISVADGELVPSIVSCYSAANWFEREIWDLFGIVFSGHPDLRRILTDYGFAGHPLRKDFPLTGFVQVKYDDTEKRVINEPVNLIQDFRVFDFESPWEGSNYPIPSKTEKQEK